MCRTPERASVPSGNHHIATLAAECLGQRQPYASAAAGNHGDFAFQRLRLGHLERGSVLSIADQGKKLLASFFRIAEAAQHVRCDRR